MTRLVVTRLLTLVPMMFIVTSVVFFMIRFVPGDPARIIVGNQRITQANLQNIRKQYRLDKPVVVQYGYWIRDLAHGNLGRSFQQRTEVRTLISARLPLTIKLTVFSFILSLLI
jgi:peptide/nickel transport system permease protein